ncbi:hypothetical protein BDK51DRAFT_41162 [Blyttiomyces helicus]|uniref:Uncharacterized protein n=1 Tax=Blyttiomyces helicus TaxID=388810 RepID=A0A4P9W1M7_9FUNG|nr:hypothetical protein BDK51DRAFT_41162 [Blyttiomyces helicus]|eukprot:RKO85582.1 hypothetical protein BDK51DRAFT_41162 [Blyttiomyces helicus]
MTQLRIPKDIYEAIGCTIDTTRILASKTSTVPDKKNTTPRSLPYTAPQPLGTIILFQQPAAAYRGYGGAYGSAGRGTAVFTEEEADLPESQDMPNHHFEINNLDLTGANGSPEHGRIMGPLLGPLHGESGFLMAPAKNPNSLAHKKGIGGNEVNDKAEKIRDERAGTIILCHSYYIGDLIRSCGRTDAAPCDTPIASSAQLEPAAPDRVPPHKEVAAYQSCATTGAPAISGRAPSGPLRINGACDADLGGNVATGRSTSGVLHRVNGAYVVLSPAADPAITIASDTSFKARVSHLNLKYHFLRADFLRIPWVPIQATADGFTKALPLQAHSTFVSVLGLAGVPDGRGGSWVTHGGRRAGDGGIEKRVEDIGCEVSGFGVAARVRLWAMWARR